MKTSLYVYPRQKEKLNTSHRSNYNFHSEIFASSRTEQIAGLQTEGGLRVTLNYFLATSSRDVLNNL